MVDFSRQRQFKTREGVLPVDKGLPPGIHIFQLVVADQSGNKSKAALVKVEIMGIRAPGTPTVPGTPVIPAAPVRLGRRPRPR